MEKGSTLSLLAVLHILSVCTSNDDICTGEGNCQLVDNTAVPLCRSMRHLYNTTRFPTSLHSTQELANIELESFENFNTIYSECSEVATSFLCVFYIPPCFVVTGLGRDCTLVLSPCQYSCQLVNDCLLQKYGVTEDQIASTLPAYLHCSNFDNSGPCWGPPPNTVTSTTSSVATSTSSVATSTSRGTASSYTVATRPVDSLSLSVGHSTLELFYTSANLSPSATLDAPLSVGIIPSLTDNPSLHSLYEEELSTLLLPSHVSFPFSQEQDSFTSTSVHDGLSNPQPSYTSFSQEHSSDSFTNELYHTSSFVVLATSPLPHIQTQTTDSERTSTITSLINASMTISLDLQPSQSVLDLERSSRGHTRTEIMLSVILCLGLVATAFIL